MFNVLYRVCTLSLLLVIVTACSSSVAAPQATPTSAPASAVTAAPMVVLPTVAALSPTIVSSPIPVASATPEASATPVPPTLTPAPVVQVGSLALPRGIVSSRPFAVMIDNHPNAYPQTGLSQAAIVFEALAEFGLTRYMAVFVPGVSADLDKIGPVRSARPYFVEWAKGLRAVYAHAGGSPEGLLLAETSVELINMDALRRVAGGSFVRSSDRDAPHNLYTSSADIAAFATAQAVEDLPKTGELSEIGFLLKDEAVPAERPSSQSFSYYFIYKETYVGWSYDPASNSYLYFRQDRPHIDAATGEQLQFKNVVVIEVPEQRIVGDPKGRIEQQVIGEGRARLFCDGRMVEAIWKKPAGYAQLQFFSVDGTELKLNPGSTWIAAIPSLDNLTVEGGI